MQRRFNSIMTLEEKKYSRIAKKPTKTENEVTKDITFGQPNTNKTVCFERTVENGAKRKDGF